MKNVLPTFSYDCRMIEPLQARIFEVGLYLTKYCTDKRFLREADGCHFTGLRSFARSISFTQPEKRNVLYERAMERRPTQMRIIGTFTMFDESEYSYS